MHIALTNVYKLYMYVIVCINAVERMHVPYEVSGFKQEYTKHQEKHKCISNDGAFCCSYSGDGLGIQ